MAPSEPSRGSEKMISVPNARAMSLRALDTFDGITSFTGIPRAAPKSEYATPVLPLVESISGPAGSRYERLSTWPMRA